MMVAQWIHTRGDALGIEWRVAMAGRTLYGVGDPIGHSRPGDWPTEPGKSAGENEYYSYRAGTSLRDGRLDLESATSIPTFKEGSAVSPATGSTSGYSVPDFQQWNGSTGFSPFVRRRNGKRAILAVAGIAAAMAVGLTLLFNWDVLRLPSAASRASGIVPAHWGRPVFEDDAFTKSNTPFPRGKPKDPFSDEASAAEEGSLDPLDETIVAEPLSENVVDKVRTPVRRREKKKISPESSSERKPNRRNTGALATHSVELSVVPRGNIKGSPQALAGSTSPIRVRSVRPSDDTNGSADIPPGSLHFLDPDSVLPPALP